MRAAASLFFFLVAQDGKLSLLGSHGWAEGALKRQARNNNRDAAIKVLSVSAVFLLVCSVFVMVGGSSRPKNWACGSRDLFLSATARVRCAMVCGRGLGYCSGRLPLRFAFNRLGRGHRRGRKSPQTLPGVLTDHEHATPRWINSQIVIEIL